MWFQLTLLSAHSAAYGDLLMSGKDWIEARQSNPAHWWG